MSRKTALFSQSVYLSIQCAICIQGICLIIVQHGYGCSYHWLLFYILHYTLVVVTWLYSYFSDKNSYLSFYLTEQRLLAI